MFKNEAVLEVKGTEKRIYKFHCDPKSPLGEVFDSLCTMKSYVFEQMKLQEMRENEAKKEAQPEEG